MTRPLTPEEEAAVRELEDEVLAALLAVSTGRFDTYLEIILEVAHTRKRYLRGIRFPRAG